MDACTCRVYFAFKLCTYTLYALQCLQHCDKIIYSSPHHSRLNNKKQCCVLKTLLGSTSFEEKCVTSVENLCIPEQACNFHCIELCVYKKHLAYHKQQQ